MLVSLKFLKENLVLEDIETIFLKTKKYFTRLSQNKINFVDSGLKILQYRNTLLLNLIYS